MTGTDSEWDIPDPDAIRADEMASTQLPVVNTEIDPMIGRVLGGRYRVESILGKGAMGAVYRARHVKVGRIFAVKMLHERLLVDPKTAKRFEREASLAGKLHHANVVGVIDVGETDDGIHFMVMEYAEGHTLGTLMDGAMTSARVLGLSQQLCDGLQHAHEHGLIHRDFKPENVIVETDQFGSERPRIVDFGIAILREDATDPTKEDRLTTAGLVLGTPHYMAPEHAMGGGIDHRIDLFALGVIMYELLTGWLPYDGDGVDVARANLLTPTPPMIERVPGVVVDPLLEAFTRHLMQKRPEDRPETAKAARHLLDVIEKDRPMAARLLGIALPTGDIAPVVPETFVMPAHAPETLSGRTLASAMSSGARPALSSMSSPSWPAVPLMTTSGSLAVHGFMPDFAPSAVPTGSSPLLEMYNDAEEFTVEAPTPRPAPAASRRAGPIDAGMMLSDARRGPTGVALAPTPRRWTLFAGFGAALAAVAGVLIATRSEAAHATQPSKPVAAIATRAAVVIPAPTPVVAAPAAPAIVVRPAPTEIAASPPPAMVKQAAPRVVVRAAAPPTRVTTQSDARQFATAMTGPVKPTALASTAPLVRVAPVVADTSASGVASLYGMVGRELKRLDESRGSQVTSELWSRFRQIRINEAIASVDARSSATRTLTQLRTEIAANR